VATKKPKPEPKATAQRPLTANQVATILGVHKGTVRAWCENGSIDAWKLPGGHWRIEQETVDAIRARR
jgi:excisionase family DNA binding protein